MRKYVSYDRKALRKSTRIAAVVAGIFMIGLAVYIKSWHAAFIGIVLLLAMVLQKEIAMTEKGLEVNYDMIVYQYKELWTYEEIEDIHKELSPDGTKMALHVMKDVMSRKLIYDLDVYEEVIALAQEKNPKIHVADVDF
ncbi:MAG: hypothetical protein IKK48_04030 [Firmicutes bacterium]|nr:hypothetical protein [Bacillota bacterium]